MGEAKWVRKEEREREEGRIQEEQDNVSEGAKERKKMNRMER